MNNNFYTNFELDWDYLLLSHYKNGKKCNERIKLRPYLFVPAATNTPYKSYDDKSVMRVDFTSVKEAREFVRSYEGVSNVKIYGFPHYHYTHIYENFKNIKFDKSQLKVFNFDIEVDTVGGYPKHNMADKEINLITAKIFGSKDIYTLGLGEYKNTSKEIEIQKLRDQGYQIHYRAFDNEKDLLFAFMQLWEKLAPDVVTGWNVRFFDIPYVIKRLSYHFSDEIVNKLSPFGKIKSDVVTMFNKENDVYSIVGIPTLDYMDIYKKFSFSNEESYSLNYLSGKILGATKLDYSEYGTLAKLQVGNWEKFTDYNIIDVIRVEQIDEKVRFMDIAFEVAYETKTNYTDSLTTIRVWDVMIHNYLMDRNITVPYSSDNRKERQIAGGFVKDPQLGKHKWVMSFDFKSLYPHLCMTFNISPDTYLGTFKPIFGLMSVEKILDGQLVQYTDQMIQNNATITGCGTVFSKKKKGFAPAIMEHLFDLRAEHSKKEDKYTKEYAESKDPEIEKQAQIFASKSLAIKYILNGGYGAFSNEYYRFFADQIAESFTLSGQLAIKTVEKYVNRKLNEYYGATNLDFICAIDTDSVYLVLDKIVEKFCDIDPVDFLEEFSKVIQGWIQESLEELYSQTNAFQKKLFMSLESIGPAIWMAKKRYVMSLPSYKKVRYNPPKIKIMGIEAVRSSTPQIARKWITDAIPLALAGEEREMKAYVDDKWNQFSEADFASIAMPRGTNDLEKYANKNTIYEKGCPLHVRGALLYNSIIRKNSLEDTINEIASGDKVKVMYLKMPNPIMENVIAIPEDLPKEFDFLIDYVDYSLQFDKVFLDPLKRITNAAGISLSNDISMEGFFQ